MPLYVRVRDTRDPDNGYIGGDRDLLFEIVELGDRLGWRVRGLCPDRAPRAFRLPRTGRLGGTDVNEHEAGVLTGLLPPACWDRLRELVYEGGEL